MNSPSVKTLKGLLKSNDDLLVEIQALLENCDDEEISTELKNIVLNLNSNNTILTKISNSLKTTGGNGIPDSDRINEQYLLKQPKAVLINLIYKLSPGSSKEIKLMRKKEMIDLILSVI